MSTINAKTGRSLGRRFRQLLAATISSNAADGIVMVILPLLVLRITTDPLAVSAARIAAYVPAVLLSIVVGTIVDTSSRRGLMAASNIIRAGLLACLGVAIWQDSLALWMIIVAALGFAAFEGIHDTATTTTVPDLVDSGDLERANGRIVTGQQVTQGFIAAPVGTISLAMFAPLPTGISMALLLFGVAMIFRAVPRHQSGPPGATDDHNPFTLWQRTQEGLSYLHQSRTLRRLALVSPLVIGIFALAQGTYIYYLVQVLDVPEALVGVLAVPPALGAIAGATTVSKVTARFGTFPIMSVVLLGQGFALAGASVVPPNATGWIIFASLSASMAVLAAWWNVLVATARQRLVPRRLLGRVSGVIFTFVAIASPIGTLASGLLARVDGRLPWLVAGIGMAMIAVLARPLLRDIAQHTGRPDHHTESFQGRR
ncbi:MFS transporter [Georgenia muralis]|uniref:MFS transporter n=1 Tax=Georgenia muralis TaxID=154117 RepID=A0A3N4Z665_9MICO|nr:MFS transporter [Georgenia muralis]RPF27286.1 MFS transporter [Georgenia muralis]